MSPDPVKARDIFLQAVEQHEPSQRQALLDEACGDSPELRREVEVLLAAHERAGSFLENGPVAIDETLDQPIAEGPGTVIGPYKLLQEIGHGGMGVVFMAEQTEPVARRVALKIIKPGMDTRQVIARFEAERQALAMMDHPNIAKVLDAGTTGRKDEGGRMKDEGKEAGHPDSSFILPPPSFADPGRPYFVMELVKGVPITQYCDEQHLTPRQRLELFVPVCQACSTLIRKASSTAI